MRTKWDMRKGRKNNGNFLYESISGKVKQAEEQGALNAFDFSILIQSLLISKNGWVIDTGNYENVNAVIASKLFRKIKNHPFLWKMFFMIG